MRLIGSLLPFKISSTARETGPNPGQIPPEIPTDQKEEYEDNSRHSILLNSMGSLAANNTPGIP